MWSLPDIQRLNADAESFKSTLDRIVSASTNEDGEPLKCNYAGDDCNGEIHAIEYYDIFSDTPKGHVDLCERHYGHYGPPDEGFFECEGCNRVLVENYTWELYRHDDDQGTLCLNCCRKRVLSDGDSWLELTPANIESVNFEQVRKAPHLIAAGQDCPKELEFLGNAEFDSMDGHYISGGGIEGLRGLLQSAQVDGHKRAILILDAAYQFAVSIGAYVDSSANRTEYWGRQ